MSQATEEIGLTPQPADQETCPTNASSSHDLRPVTQRRQILILLSSFLTICITIGFNQSYGVFQSYYTSPSQDMLPPEAQSQSAWIAFVGTLGAGLTWGGSIVVNPLMARVRDVRILTVLGVLCMSAGFGVASLGTEVGGIYSFCALLLYIFLGCLWTRPLNSSNCLSCGHLYGFD